MGSSPESRAQSGRSPFQKVFQTLLHVISFFIRQPGAAVTGTEVMSSYRQLSAKRRDDCAGEDATEPDPRSAPAAQRATDTDGGEDAAQAPTESHAAPALVVQNDGGLRRESRY